MDRLTRSPIASPRRPAELPESVTLANFWHPIALTEGVAEQTSAGRATENGLLAIGGKHSFEVPDREFAGGDCFDIVLDQNRRVVESDRPEETPTDLREELQLEVPDATGIAYRRMLGPIGGISHVTP